MLNIKFRYRDTMSDWEWRTQEYTGRSLENCIDLYGLGMDCDYEILEIKDLDAKLDDFERTITWRLPNKDLPPRYETVLLSIIDINGVDMVTIGGYDYMSDNFMTYDNGNLSKVVAYPERVTAWSELPRFYNDIND